MTVIGTRWRRPLQRRCRRSPHHCVAASCARVLRSSNQTRTGTAGPRQRAGALVVGSSAIADALQQRSRGQLSASQESGLAIRVEGSGWTDQGLRTLGSAGGGAAAAGSGRRPAPDGAGNTSFATRRQRSSTASHQEVAPCTKPGPSSGTSRAAANLPIHTPSRPPRGLQSALTRRLLYSNPLRVHLSVISVGWANGQLFGGASPRRHRCGGI